MLKECELTQQRAAETGKCDVISSPLRRRVEQPADTVRSAYLLRKWSSERNRSALVKGGRRGSEAIDPAGPRAKAGCGDSRSQYR
jgi:hypothetical protein